MNMIKKTLLRLIPIALFMGMTITVSAQRIPQQYADVCSPDIPASVKICGQTIDLNPTIRYESFDRELSSLIYGHGTTMLIIKRANRFFPEMAPILEANGVPSDIMYLAAVESSLNPRALSPAKAGGLWQFMESTAKEYGLEVNDEVDERYNIEKATAAAARYLKKSYQRLGDWPSVMAAYNGGNARINRELEAQGQDSSLDLYLTEETTRYPYRIMALKTLMENPGAYGYHLRADQLYQPRRYRTVTVNGPVADWPDWARNQGISYQILREENPWIRSKKLTNRNGKSYQVRIPVNDSLQKSRSGVNTFNRKWADR